MEITPINLDELKVNSATTPKKRGRPAKKATKTVTDPVGIVENEEMEMKRLREQLLNYADHNEDIVTRSVNNKLTKLVNEMSIDELRARCRQGKKINSGRMDSVVGQQIIQVCNMAVGQLLDCMDELNESTRKDKLLNETVTGYLSLHILDYIPEEIKIMGIYGSHTLTAYQQSLSKKPNKPFVPAIPPAPMVEQVKEVKLQNKDIESIIPRIQEVKDKLIRFRQDLDNEN